MRNNQISRILAFVIFAISATTLIAQPSFQVVQGETKTYTVNPSAGSATPASYAWTYSGGSVTDLTGITTNSATITWSVVGGPYTLTVTPFLNCNFPSKAKTASITVLDPTIDINWTAAVYTECSNVALTVAVQASGFNFTTGNTYEAQLSVNGGADTWTTLAFTDATVNGSVDVTIANTTSANTTPTLIIKQIRINGGTPVDVTDHSRTVTITPEPTLDDITTN